MSDVIDDPALDQPEIVHWSPRRGPLVGSGHGAPAAPPAAVALGAVAFGAFAIGALAIGALAIGRLAVGRARFKDVRIGRLVVDELVVRRWGLAPRCRISCDRRSSVARTVVLRHISQEARWFWGGKA